MLRIRNLRWWIAALLATATGLSYLDRQNLPVAVVEIQKTLPISDAQFAQFNVMFLFAYATMYAVGGKLLDVLGTRWGYALMVAWWSAATISHGLVTSVLGLGIARFMVGLGEGGGFPGSAKAVSEWFPPRERSFAFGIFNTGSSIGAVAAPFLIAQIILHLNWRWAFYITGAFGVVWLCFWWALYDRPEKHERITAEERDYLKQSQAASQSVSRQDEFTKISWGGLFRFRQTWGLVVVKFLTDSAWFFYIFWLPKYLSDARHLDIKQIGYYAWIPYAFAGVGSFVGGWLSSFLIKRRISIDRSRKIALAISAGMMPVSILIVASPLSLAILFFGLAFLGHQFWSTIVQTLAADIYPSTSVGSVAGLMGASGSFGAMLFSYLVGQLLTYTHSYSPILIIVGLLHPLSFFVVLAVVRRIEPLKVWRQKLATNQVL